MTEHPNKIAEATAEAVTKAEGITASERYLAKLATRTFLNLWCYPNLSSAPGKELCDLLAVCGDHILIFSDKTIEWPASGDVNISWSRWYKRAIEKSAAQVRGAARWIEHFPDRVFLDQACTKRLPLTLPPPESRKVHGVVVARGAGQACREYFGGGSGSLRITSALRGSDHINPEAPLYGPFAIGDVNPDGAFVHVLDDATLDILMRELDTVTDLTNYLDRKARFMRSGVQVFAAGEEEMLAEYVRLTNESGEHDFVRRDGALWRETGDAVFYDEGLYEGLRADPRYLIKKQADRVSYLWDSLIEAFTGPMLARTTLVPAGGKFVLAEHERAVRFMALENRTMRRAHGEAVAGAAEKAKGQDRFFRAMLPAATSPQQKTGFFCMFLRYPVELALPGGYEQYRQVRRHMLEAYALGLFDKHRHLDRVVGIALEPPKNPGEPAGSSEDLILLEPEEWTPEMSAEDRRMCAAYDALKEGVAEFYHKRVNEYPVADLPPSMSRGSHDPNRRQRRAQAAKQRRGSKVRD